MLKLFHAYLKRKPKNLRINYEIRVYGHPLTKEERAQKQADALPDMAQAFERRL